jgi:hypothetical protein
VWLVAACVCAAVACRFMRDTAGSGGVSNVDLYNSASGTWSTAQLSVARYFLAATSVGNVAIFAGGYINGNSSFAQSVEGLLLVLFFVGDALLRRVACCCMCLCCSSLPSHEGYCSCWNDQCCGFVQQCYGYMVDCSAQCSALLVGGHICWERGHLCWG